jgi:hypothetical protein
MNKIIQIAILILSISFNTLASNGDDGKKEKEPKENRIYSCVLCDTNQRVRVKNKKLRITTSLIQNSSKN